MLLLNRKRGGWFMGDYSFCYKFLRGSGSLFLGFDFIFGVGCMGIILGVCYFVINYCKILWFKIIIIFLVYDFVG